MLSEIDRGEEDGHCEQASEQQGKNSSCSQWLDRREAGGRVDQGAILKY